MFQYKFDSPQVNRKWISTLKVFINKSPYNMTNDVRPKILENLEMLDQYQNCVETQA